jgi:hypothetical protein
VRFRPGEQGSSDAQQPRILCCDIPFGPRIVSRPGARFFAEVGVSTVARTIKMRWKLVSGRDYMGFRAVPGDMRMFWAWD